MDDDSKTKEKSKNWFSDCSRPSLDVTTFVTIQKVHFVFYSTLNAL